MSRTCAPLMRQIPREHGGKLFNHIASRPALMVDAPLLGADIEGSQQPGETVRSDRLTMIKFGPGTFLQSNKTVDNRMRRPLGVLAGSENIPQVPKQHDALRLVVVH